MNLISTIKSLFNYLTLYMGGGGSSAPTQQNVTQTSIPDYARPYVETALGKTAALTDINQNPYQPYQGQQVADLSALQQQAMGSIGGQQVASQLGDATNLAYNVGQQGFNAGNAYRQQATSADAMSQYMSPYMQNVVDVQSQEARRQADITRQGTQAQAARSGAFGGSRSAIVQAEGDRNLATQLGQIQAQGSQNAFQQAQQAQQFGANLGLQGLNAAGSAASTLGALGQTQFGQQMGINQAQMQAGALQQAQQQRGLDVAFQQYQDQLNYPYKQLAFQSDMFRGLPLSQSATTMYQNTGAMAPQLLGAGIAAYGATQRAKEGGLMKGYAEGGITTVDPSVPSSIGPQALSNRLAKLSDEQLMAYARTVKDAVALAEVKGEIQRRQEAREPQGQMPTGTVAQGIAPSEEQGQMQPPMMAGGGIVALAGGTTPEIIEDLGKANKALGNTPEDKERRDALAQLNRSGSLFGYVTQPGAQRAANRATLAELQNAPIEDIRAYRDTGAIPRSEDPFGTPAQMAALEASNAQEAERRQANAQARAQGSMADSTDPLGDSSAVPLPPPPTEFPEEGASPVTGTTPSSAPPGTVPGGIVPSRAPAGQAPVAAAPAGQAPAGQAPAASTGIVSSSKAPTAMATGAIPIANPGDPMGWGAYKASVEDAAKLDPEQKAVLEDMRKRSERKMGRAEKQEKNVFSESLIAGGLAMMGGLNLSDGVRRLAEGGGKKYFESSAAANKAIEAADDAQSAFDQYQLSLKQGNKKVAADMYGKFHNSMLDYQGKIQAASISAAASGAATAEAAKSRTANMEMQERRYDLDRDALMQRHAENVAARENEFKVRMEQEGNTKMYQQMQLLDGRQRDLMAERRLTEKTVYDRYATQIDQIRMAESTGKPLSEALRRQKVALEAQVNADLIAKLAPINKQLEDVVLRKGEMMNIPAPSSSGGFRIVGVR